MSSSFKIIAILATYNQTIILKDFYYTVITVVKQHLEPELVLFFNDGIATKCLTDSVTDLIFRERMEEKAETAREREKEK